MVPYCPNPDCKVHNEDLFRPPEVAPLIGCCLFIFVGLALFATAVVAAIIFLVNIKG
jgi:hypothetical protein